MASSSCAATPSSILTDRDRVIGELTRGREIANKLRRMLRETGFDGGASAQDLVGRLLDTFTQSISVLCAGVDSDEVSQVPVVVESSGLKLEDSGDSCKTPAGKDRRGCYKRKKSSETLIKDTPTFDDGHAWRKYGQKTILRAKFPRNYFRCTHKFDKGCQASKQVQQIQEDPTLYRTTYYGHHTCNNFFKSPHHIIVDDRTQDSSILLSFGNGFVFDFTEAVKREKVEPSGPDYYIPPELTVFDGSDDHLGGPFSPGSDRGDVISSDVYSCTESTRDVDMDMMVGSVDIDDFLQLS